MSHETFIGILVIWLLINFATHVVFSCVISDFHHKMTSITYTDLIPVFMRHEYTVVLKSTRIVDIDIQFSL